MELTEAIQVAERLEREDCIGTTSQALRTLLRAYTSLTEALEEERLDHRMTLAQFEGSD
jgi:hypothetical protein